MLNYYIRPMNFSIDIEITKVLKDSFICGKLSGTIIGNFEWKIESSSNNKTILSHKMKVRGKNSLIHFFYKTIVLPGHKLQHRIAFKKLEKYIESKK